MRGRLLSSTVIPAIFGAVVGTGGACAALREVNAPAVSKPANPSWNPQRRVNPMARKLPDARANGAPVRLAAACNPCNPCAVKPSRNPCKPCAPKKASNPCNPCSPCSASNPCAPGGGCSPCSPCAAKGKVSDKCFVPRLRQAAKCNPCAAKYLPATNPCNPCGASNPCNPCNPCAASNPCNPCNPCGGAAFDTPELSGAEAVVVYDCLRGTMTAGYAKSGDPAATDYQNWTNMATQPYVSATHASRYVNNFANTEAADAYRKYEEAGTMPVGSVLAKDSFLVNPAGGVTPGPLFLMEKMAAGFFEEGGDWKYTMIMSNGATVGETGGKGAAAVQFCHDCHVGAEDQDFVMFLPDEYRK